MIMIRHIIGYCVLLVTLLLAGCEAMLGQKYDVDSEYFHIPAGSQLILNRSLDIPAGSAHVLLQHGKVVSGADQYAVNCECEVRTLGPGKVQPGTFSILRTERSHEWISQPNILRFYRVLHLRSTEQPDVLKLVCQDWDGPLFGRNISIPEIREAVGGFIALEFDSR